MQPPSNKRLAQQWPFPKHKAFEKELRKAASAWFEEKGFPVHSRMAYCLAGWEHWEKNIILEEVAEYINRCKDESEKEGKPYPLHKYLHHGLSSQAAAFNLVGPLITRGDYEPLMKALGEQGVDLDAEVCSASFEYEDKDVFNEDAGQPTSIDVALRDGEGKPVVFVESKLVEREFGGCSVFAHGDCDGMNPLGEKERCYLHFIGRRYWELVEKYGFAEALRDEKECVFVAHYQFFREVLFSLEKGGVFVLLSDERSPVFHCEAEGKRRGLMPFLSGLVPREYRGRIASVSMQALVRHIRESGRHDDWVGEFERKYGVG